VHRLAALLLVAALAAVSVGVTADTSLEAAVAAVYGTRASDVELHQIAHARAVEISVGFDPTTGYAPSFSHDLMRTGTAEVLAWNMNVADPVSHAVEQWQASPPHNAILSDASLARIGCASYAYLGAWFFACVLAGGTATVAPPALPAPPPPEQPPSPAAPEPPPPQLPDTAMPLARGGIWIHGPTK
jgi:hypothetical protein